MLEGSKYFVQVYMWKTTRTSTDPIDYPSTSHWTMTPTCPSTEVINYTVP